jgi:hypothetical protein
VAILEQQSNSTNMQRLCSEAQSLMMKTQSGSIACKAWLKSIRGLTERSYR